MASGFKWFQGKILVNGEATGHPSWFLAVLQDLNRSVELKGKGLFFSGWYHAVCQIVCHMRDEHIKTWRYAILEREKGD